MHICQLAYHVENAEAAAREWATTHGAGPFFVSRNIPLTGVFHNGQPSALDHTSAYGWMGEQMVELVQQNCDTPSVFSDHPYGLHHCAYFTPQLDSELERLRQAGCETRFVAGTSSGVQFAFVQQATGAAALGHYLEVYQEHPVLRQFYAMVEAAAKDWDGGSPVRDMIAQSR